MKRRICLAALLGLGLNLQAPAQETAAPPAPVLASVLETAGFRVVVHAANPTTTMERSRISKVFLKKIRSWSDSRLSVLAVDQGEESPVREAFSLAIHEKKVSAIISYWNRKTFSGRDVPWPELGSDRAVLDFVGGNPGAIGYVSVDAELGDNVRELRVTGP